jgi:hypothetical protein
MKKKTETHILEYEGRRVTIRIEDRLPADVPFVQVSYDFQNNDDEASMKALKDWLTPILAQYRPYVVRFGDDEQQWFQP